MNRATAELSVAILLVLASSIFTALRLEVMALKE
jgi:hypothetical protein